MHAQHVQARSNLANILLYINFIIKLSKRMKKSFCEFQCFMLLMLASLILQFQTFYCLSIVGLNHLLH